MRAVIQRASRANVKVDGKIISEIGKGLLVLLSVEDADTDEDVKYMADKITNLRIFEDENEKMNLSLVDVGGELLVVSQFTLHGDCRKGRRPGFSAAGKPDYANQMYEKFVSECKKLISTVVTGEFQATMLVELVNDGPVTMLVDSKKLF